MNQPAQLHWLAISWEHIIVLVPDVKMYLFYILRHRRINGADQTVFTSYSHAGELRPFA